MNNALFISCWCGQHFWNRFWNRWLLSIIPVNAALRLSAPSVLP
jgi:hypothetical protein